MSWSRRVGGGAALQVLARLFTATVSLVVTAILLARLLDKDEYGRFSFYLNAFLLVLVLVDFGINRAAIRRIADGSWRESDAIGAAVRLKTRFGIAAFLALAVLIGAGERDPTTIAILLVAAAHTLTHGLSAGSVGFEAAVEFRPNATSAFVGYGVFLALSLAFAAYGVRQAAPYLLAFGAGLAAQNVFLHAWARRRFPVPTAPTPSLVRELLREALPLGFSAVSVAIYYYTDSLLLRPLAGDAAVATYTVAYRLMTFGLMAPVLFSQVLFPVFTRCHVAGPRVLTIAVARATLVLALLAACGATMIATRAEDWLALVFGESYRDAAPALRVLCVAMAVVFLTYPHTTALIAAGRAATFTRITIVAALLNVALNLVVLPRYGPVGAATTTLITEGFVLIAGCASAWRLLRVSGWSSSLWAPVALAGVLAIVLTHWPQLPLVWVAIVSLASTLVIARISGALPFDLGVDAALERGDDDRVEEPRSA
jgi:O-antigen/teichoic acid export membrane protein